MPVVIPDAVLLIGAFFLLATALILRGMLAGYSYSFGSMFAWLAAHLRVRLPKPWGGHFTVNIGAPFGVIDDVIVKTLQKGIADTEKYLAYTWHAAEKLLRYMTQAIDSLAKETAATFEWLVHVRLRAILAAMNPALLVPILLSKLLPALLQHVRSGTVRIVHTIEHTVTHTVTRVVRSVPAVVPGVRGLPGLRKEVYGLTKRWSRINARLRKVEALFGVAAMAAAMANVLGLPNWRCLTRGNVGKTARRLCGMPSHWLDDVLGLLADFFILENICTVLPWLETAASEIGTPLVAVLTEVGSGLCAGATAPAPLRGPKASVPDLIFGVSTAGV